MVNNRDSIDGRKCSVGIYMFVHIYRLVTAMKNSVQYMISYYGMCDTARHGYRLIMRKVWLRPYLRLLTSVMNTLENSQMTIFSHYGCLHSYQVTLKLGASEIGMYV